MMNGSVWLIKLIFSHLLTDFILQPGGWVEDRSKKHFASGKLYLHGLVTAVVAYIFIGWQYWLVAVIILVTHTIIDGWKSYQAKKIRYFLIDQVLHLTVIAACWWLTFRDMNAMQDLWRRLNANPHHWVLLTAFVFVTTPAGILIGQLTGQWSRKIDDPQNSLANAGKKRTDRKPKPNTW